MDDSVSTRRTTNFNIDDILSPDFGSRKSLISPEPPAPRGPPSPDSGSTERHLTCSGVTEMGARVWSTSKITPVKYGSHSKIVKLTGETQSQPCPAWVYCTRYSDRPSAGPRSKKSKKAKHERANLRPRATFTIHQQQKLMAEFLSHRYITEHRRQVLAQELNMKESQIQIWFQNKRATVKRASGIKNALAQQLMAQGLYNHKREYLK